MPNEVTVTQNQLTAKITREKFLKVYSPKNCLLYSHKLKSITDAIDAPAPSIGQIIREQGGEFTRNFLKLWLVYLNEFLNLNKPMNESQIEVCAMQLYSDYSHLKITDLSFLYKRIINGEYGEFFESLSIAKVMTFFREYEAERTEHIVNEREREHAEFRHEEAKNENSMDFFKRQIKKTRR